MARARTLALALLTVAALALAGVGTRAGAEEVAPRCPARHYRVVIGEPVAFTTPCVPFRSLPSRDLRGQARQLERNPEACGTGGVVVRVTQRRGVEFACRVSV